MDHTGIHLRLDFRLGTRQDLKQGKYIVGDGTNESKKNKKNRSNLFHFCRIFISIIIVDILFSSYHQSHQRRLLRARRPPVRSSVWRTDMSKIVPCWAGWRTCQFSKHGPFHQLKREAKKEGGKQHAHKTKPNTKINNLFSRGDN